jgi:hypothetical protein
MTFGEKYEFAIHELENTDILEANYNPPIVAIGRMLGFKTKPLHYYSFLHNFISIGLFSGWTFTLAMVFLQDITEPVVIAVIFTFTGISFGLLMAFYYKSGFKKHNLTPWNEMK